jgi:DNA adenine methylase
MATGSRKGVDASSRKRLPLPLKTHRPGGKFYLAPQLVELMPRHKCYVEPCAGGLAPLLYRNPDDQSLWWPGTVGVSEVVNDLSGDLSNFWRVMASPSAFALFERRCTGTPFSENVFVTAKSILTTTEWAGIVDPDRAWAFFVVCRQSLAGRCKGFTPITKTRTRSGMNNEASAWVNAVDGLRPVHERLRRVVVLDRRKALDVIRQNDEKSTFFYLDPPYLIDTRAAKDVYQHEMTATDHRDLLVTLGGKKAAAVVKLDGGSPPDWYKTAKPIQGKFLLSGYHSPMYDAVAEACGWHVKEFQLPNNAAGGKSKRVMTEVVWANYDLTKPRGR